MNLRAATPRVSTPAIDLRHQLPAIRQFQRYPGPAGWRSFSAYQPQAEKSSRMRRFVPEEIRGTPLVGADEVQSAIAIDVRDGDASRHHRLGQPELRGDVVVSAIRAAHKKRIPVGSAQICSRPKAGPKARVMDDLVVAGSQGLQFGPAIDFAFDESASLHRFQHAVIVEIREARVPAEAAARKTKLLAVLEIGSNALFHLLHMTCALPKEMTLCEAEFRGDVAHINVRDAVSVDVSEITSHPLEGIVSEHARFGCGEMSASFQFRKFQVARLRPIVQETIRSE